MTEGDYTVAARGPHSRLWQRLSWVTNQNGTVTIHTNRYQELQTGLHYLENSQWLESREVIEILPDGSGAVARKGQHRAFFPANIYRGAIELTTPDGQQLRSRPLGISYFDGEKSVLIAELQDSLGQLLPSGNQVIWTNCFTDIQADLVATYRKGGFECDLIFRARPPAPSEWDMGADPRLQLITEFFDTAEPVQELGPVDEQDGLRDTTLKFGTAMQMGRGKAFSIGGQAAQADQEPGGWIPVYKSWERLRDARNPAVLRTCLIEEVPYRRIEPHLRRLAAIDQPARAIAAAAKQRPRLSGERQLPTSRPVESTEDGVLVAQATLDREPGVVLDYTTVISQAGYTFRGDETYFLSSAVTLSGNVIWEPGSVLKYASNASLTLGSGSTLDWQATAFGPVNFTARDDNSIGQVISGSTGNPSFGAYANPALTLYTSAPLTNFRIAFAQLAIAALYSSPSFTFYDGQLVNCAKGIEACYSPVHLRNVLVANVQTAITGPAYSGVSAQNATFSGVTTLANASSQYASLTLTNCILANVASLGTPAPTGDYNGFFNSPLFGATTVTNPSVPFQTVGAGAHYLVEGSPFRNSGTTNINADLLAALRRKTTYPPLILSNKMVSTDTTLSPQAQRDTDTPDLGYEYAPLDYLVCNYKATNCTLTISGGAAIGYYDETGLWLQDGAQIMCVGTPYNPNRFAHYLAVQEQPVHIGSFTAGTGIPVVPWRFGSVGSPATFRFTHFTRPAPGGSAYDLYGNGGDWRYSSLSVSDSSFANSRFSYSATSGFALTLNNNCFERCLLWLVHYDAGGSTLSLRNNLFRYQSFCVDNFGTTAWVVKDNAFDSCGIEDWGETPPDHSHNAYINATGRLYPTNASDVVLTNFVYAQGPLGRYYQVTTNLINAGSRSADAATLYHYTTTTNQAKETNSVVDIGFHYVALNSNGLSIDTDGEGLPDYLEDTNGNGIREANETSFTNSDTDGDSLTDFEELAIFIDASNQSLGHLDPLTSDTGNTGIPDGDKDCDHDGLTNLGELRDFLSQPWTAHTFNSVKNDAEYLFGAESGGANTMAGLTPSFPGGGLIRFTIRDSFPNADYDLYFIPEIVGWKMRRICGGIRCGSDGKAVFTLPDPDPGQGYFIILEAGDKDGDGLSNGYESWFKYNGQLTVVDRRDSDGDQMRDGWEVAYGLDPTSLASGNGATGNPDGDSYNNFQEYNGNSTFATPTYDPRKHFANETPRPVVSISSSDQVADGLDGTGTLIFF